MKYTRYNYKKKNDKGMKSIVFLITIILIALAIGTALAKVIFNGEFSIIDTLNFNKAQNNEEKQVGDSKLYGTFEIIQCGYYSKEENALETQKKLNDKVPVYVLKEGDKFRVISGIYSLDKGEGDKSKILELGVNAIRLKIAIQGDSYYDSLVYGVVDGYIKILEGLKDSKVKSVNTEEFKKWASSFEEKDDKVSEIKLIKEHINNLPTELTKDKTAQELEFISTLIEPYKSK